MKKGFLLGLLLVASTCVYADDMDATSVQQGLKEYDWQACLDAKMSTCMDSCETSEDPNCKDNCLTLAADKCKSEGLQPPAN